MSYNTFKLHYLDIKCTQNCFSSSIFVITLMSLGIEYWLLSFWGKIKYSSISVAFCYWHAICNSACVHAACSVGTFLPVVLGATPMYISRHTWLVSPAIALYCVPLPLLFLVPVTSHFPSSPTIPCSVVSEQALRRELLLEILVPYLLMV